MTIDKIFHAAMVLKNIIRPTNLVRAYGIAPDCELYLKPENLQNTGSFKLRGAGYKISQLSDEEKAKLSHLPTSLPEALDALEADHDYLTAGGVFPEALLKNFIKAKREECAELSKIPHPAEFEKYYNL